MWKAYEDEDVVALKAISNADIQRAVDSDIQRAIVCEKMKSFIHIIDVIDLKKSYSIKVKGERCSYPFIKCFIEADHALDITRLIKFLYLITSIFKNDLAYLVSCMHPTGPLSISVLFIYLEETKGYRIESDMYDKLYPKIQILWDKLLEHATPDHISDDHQITKTRYRKTTTVYQPPFWWNLVKYAKVDLLEKIQDKITVFKNSDFPGQTWAIFRKFYFFKIKFTSREN